MTPADFIAKWRNVELKERSASQSHFNDLCRLLAVEDPVAADRVGEWFTFEKGASKTGGGEGWADVWRKECFAWEYKGKRKDLDAAFAQLQRYAIALDNPPLLIVSDMDRIRIHTNWTNTVQKVHVLSLDDLADAAKRDLLRACFLNPEALKPGKTRAALTEEAATRFAALAQRLRGRGNDPQAVAHFVNRLVFCMFAEDVGLLRDKMFERMILAGRPQPDSFATHARTLFAAMRTGGMVGFEAVEWFNGGLFDSDDALPLTWEDMDDLIRATQLDWSDIDPSILGTLFERGLDPDKRSQLGAHYTDRDKILMIVNPVIVEPLLAEWAGLRAQIEALLASAPRATADRLLTPADRAAATRAVNDATALHRGFLDRLAAFRVLDPACGSGNFLYLSLLALKDIEHRVNLEAEAAGLTRPLLLGVGPENLLGIELNPYAAELARVSVWIGEIQWMRRNGYEAARNPILRKLDTIECRDALLQPDGTEAEWPAVDVIVGNPPFLGAKRMRRSLGVRETLRIRKAFAGRLPGFTDLVCYWFEKAREAIVSGRASRAGLVATNSIAKNTNLPVLRRIADNLQIYVAHSDEAWIVDGAAVRVSLIAFTNRHSALTCLLNGATVLNINANLTAGIDVSQAHSLSENQGSSMLGIQKSGPFDVNGSTARAWLELPVNPNGQSNASILKPYRNGDDLMSRSRDMWFVDLPRGLDEGEAALFEQPFMHLASHTDRDGRSLRELRKQHGLESATLRWWEPWRPRPEMRRQIESRARYLVTPETAEHRLFVWLSYPVLPDKAIIVIARDDDTTFGILSSLVHECWATIMGNRIGKGNQRRYNNSTTFETFPFPEGLTPNIPAAVYADDPRAQAIAAAAARLNELRENWLNPPDLVRRVPEVVPGYPDRILPVDAAAAKILKTRTLTNLYNQRPAWLAHAHAALDLAVAEAYGWGAEWAAGMNDDDILARLFRLNQARAGAEA